MFHILDAPPHGKEFTDMYDYYPNGCCKDKSFSNIYKFINENEIFYNVLKINTTVDRMAAIFRDNLYLYECVDIRVPGEMEDKVMILLKNCINK